MLQAGIYRQESTAWTPVSVIPYEVPSRTATASLGEPKQREGPAPRVCGSRILVANVDGKIVATPDSSGADSSASRALRVKDWIIAARLRNGTLLIQTTLFVRGRPHAFGNVKKNVEPCPTLLSTRTVPPWLSTMCFTIARPSPVPPLSRERALSTR